jgi:response regulator RpfG family c-di-GMP phosphodiesterase
VEGDEAASSRLEHILAGIGLSPIVLQIARSSHERIDGHGYPDGIAGDEIPLPARIVPQLLGAGRLRAVERVA